MDAIQTLAVVTGAVLVCSYVGTQILVRVPGTRAWVQNTAIRGYNYLDSVKAEIPAELLPTWQAAYDGCDAIIDAFADDKLTGKELRRIACEGVRLINEVRKIVA